MDRYPNFRRLLAEETAFTIELNDRDSPVAVIAPHGGNIEPHTSEIARLIAGKTYSCFCFNGMKSHNNRDLHITSHHFDEPRALALIKKSRFVVTVHGCTLRKPMVYIGGLDDRIKQVAAAQLNNQGVPCSISSPPSPYAGTRKNNLCNRGITGKGVQLEISRPLRDDPVAWASIARGVREAITQVSRS